MLKKIAVWMAALLLLLVVVAGGGLFWLQSHLQSKQFLEEIRLNISDTLGTQVHIGKLEFDLFSGFKVFETKVESPPPNNILPFLTMEKLHFSYAPLSLLQKELKIVKLDLIKPAMEVRFFSDGTSNFPKLKSEKPGSTLSLMKTDSMQLDVVLDAFHLSGGSLSILNPEGVSLFALNDTELEGRYVYSGDQASARGSISVPSMFLGPHFHITSAKSSITFADDLLEMPDIVGEAYGGRVSGLLQARFGQADPRFKINLKLDDADVSALIRDFEQDNPAVAWLNGKLRLTTQLEGSLLQPRLLTGSGEFEIKEASLSRFPFLKEIATLVGLDFILDSPFDSIRGTFKVGDQKISFFDIEAISKQFQITSVGSITFDNQCEFDLLLAIEGSQMEKLPESVTKQFATREKDGYRTITFRIWGPRNALKHNLNEKLGQAATSGVIEEIQNRVPEIKNFLDRFRNQEEPATPSPATP